MNLFFSHVISNGLGWHCRVASDKSPVNQGATPKKGLTSRLLCSGDSSSLRSSK